MPPPSADLHLLGLLRWSLAAIIVSAVGIYLNLVSANWTGGLVVGAFFVISVVSFLTTFQRYWQRHRDPSDQREENQQLATTPRRYRQLPWYAATAVAMSALCIGLAIRSQSWEEAVVSSLLALTFVDVAQTTFRNYFRWKKYCESQRDEST